MPASRPARPAAAELRHRLLVDFAGRAVPYPQDTLVADLVAERAAAHPDRVAVRWGGGSLSYGRLDGAANALAGRLASLGVRKGDLVPLHLDGGPELPVAMLALLRLGAPFVPVDPEWPRRRVAAALAALTARVLVCGPAAEPVRPPGWTALRVELAALPSAAEPPAGPRVTAADVAYGFYTSGSTGTPKCALNPHLGLVNRFRYMTRTFGADGAVVLLNSRVSFDSALWQLLWPLTAGNEVVLKPPARALDLAGTVEVIDRHGVTMTDFVPSVFDALVELAEAVPAARHGLRSLRRLYLGGEQVTARTVHRFRELVPGVRCTNTYGPTECSIGSVFHEIAPADGDSVPIGRPIDNTYALVLDRRSRLVAPGTVGEIHLGGDCLGRGYLGDATRTRRAFVPNPFPEVPGPLLYRTGDLGHQGEDGVLYFAGRTDQQVKVGGVRLELTEVEAALLTHPAVRTARVLVVAEGGEQRLVGFAVPDRAPGGDPAVTAAELRAHAARSLPAAAVPARLVLLDAMPLNGNGKADRAALARIAAAPAEEGTATVDATPAQAAVGELWRDLLGVAAVGLDDDFVTLGGTSLTAQRLALRLHTRLGARVAPRDLVRAATVRAQAALVGGGAIGGSATGAVRPSAAQLRRDVRLDPEVAGTAPVATARPRRVLLTGATGFLGAHLLRELVDGTPAQVVCLVRAGDDEQARARLACAMDDYGLWDDAVAGRVEVIAGDLGERRFGLPARRFAGLARRTDAVLHSGALVNLLMDYPALRAVNVLGAAEVLRFAATGPTTSSVLAVSTLSVVPAGGDPPVPEDAELPDARLPEDGYSQSKWVAERLYGLARSRGIPVSVYRLGEVCAHSRTGVANPRALLDTLVTACLRLGLRPPLPGRTDWTPVDAVARTLVAALYTGRGKDPVVHLLDPGGLGVGEVLDAVAARSALRPVPYPRFWAELRERAVADDDEQLTRLLTVLPDPDPEADLPDRLAGLFTDAGRHYARPRADRLLDDLGLNWPPVRGPVLTRYADHAVAQARSDGRS